MTAGQLSVLAALLGGGGLLTQIAALLKQRHDARKDQAAIKVDDRRVGIEEVEAWKQAMLDALEEQRKRLEYLTRRNAELAAIVEECRRDRAVLHREGDQLRTEVGTLRRRIVELERKEGG